MAVEMFVYRVLIGLQGNALVVLADEDAEQLLQILIGPSEAHAIARVLKGEEPERPLTHDLLSSVIVALGYRTECVTVTRLEDATFYALINTVNSAETIEIDARPSDAINVALRAGVPIYVTEEVLAEAGRSASEMREEIEEIEKFKDLISEIETPDSTTDSDSTLYEGEDTEDE